MGAGTWSCHGSRLLWASLAGILGPKLCAYVVEYEPHLGLQHGHVVALGQRRLGSGGKLVGTLAKTIINEPREVMLANGLTSPLHMSVHYISFSAHADFPQTSNFLDELRPPNIILVHGKANEMSRLKQKLTAQFDGTNTKVVSPKNCQSVEMYFTCEKMAKTIGRLAEKVPEGGESSGGLLVKKGFTYQIMAPEDLRVFTQLSTANITQRIAVPYSGSFEVIKYRLKQIYESVESATEESDVPALIVHERVTVRLDSESYVTLQWSSDPISDMVSDSVVAKVPKLFRLKKQ